MDQATLLLLVGLILAIVVVVLFALRRAWGSFPDRAGTLSPSGPSVPGMADRPAPHRYNLGPAQTPLQQTGEPSTGLTPIAHPLVRRAAEAALEKDSRAARYIVRDGDQLYVSFDQIDDPAERQAAYDLMQRFNAGEDVDIRAMMKLTRRMFEQ